MLNTTHIHTANDFEKELYTNESVVCQFSSHIETYYNRDCHHTYEMMMRESGQIINRLFS